MWGPGLLQIAQYIDLAFGLAYIFSAFFLQCNSEGLGRLCILCFE